MRQASMVSNRVGEANASDLRSESFKDTLTIKTKGVSTGSDLGGTSGQFKI